MGCLEVCPPDTTCTSPAVLFVACRSPCIGIRMFLQDTAAEVVEALQGTSLFLVGMMGSGKSTIGKLISQALGYCFFDTGEHDTARAADCFWEVNTQHQPGSWGCFTEHCERSR